MSEVRIPPPFDNLTEERHCRRFERATGKIPHQLWIVLNWLAWYGPTGVDAAGLASYLGTSPSWAERYATHLMGLGLVGYTARSGVLWYWVTDEGARAIGLLDSIGERVGREEDGRLGWARKRGT